MKQSHNPVKKMYIFTSLISFLQLTGNLHIRSGNAYKTDPYQQLLLR